MYWTYNSRGLIRAISHITDGVFNENSLKFIDRNYFGKKFPSYIFDWVLTLRSSASKKIIDAF